MRILPVINQIKDQCPLLNKQVEAGTYYIALMPDEVKFELPKSFVFKHQGPGNKANELAGNNISQEVYERVVILTAAKLIVGATEPMEDVREQIISAMMTFSPGAEYAKFSWVTDEPGRAYTSMGWHLDIFQTWRLRRG